MKKLAFLSVFILGGLIANGAWADCQVLSCDNTDGINGWVRINGNQCFFCGPGGKSCGGTDIVATLNDNREITELWQCIAMGLIEGAHFAKYSTNIICNNSPIQKNGVPNTRFVYSIDGGTTIGNYTINNRLGNIGNNACRYITCVGNRAPSADKQSCIDVNSKCKKGDGSFASTGTEMGIECNSALQTIASPLASLEHLKDNQCHGKCTANGWDITIDDGHCASGWIVDTSTRKKCVEDPAVAQRRENERRDQQRRENASKQELCESTGGTWASNKCTCDSSKNLRLDGGECKCLDDVNYKRSADGKSCDLTDAAALQRKCEAAGSAGAMWDGAKCTCIDAKKIWNGSTCIANPNIANCEAVAGAKWSNGQCVCKDADKEMNEDGTECVETEAARKKREDALKQAEQDAAKARITSITGKLNSLKAGLSTSVWKNKEGNFNTSRLVSDSVAGVVLGTAGGLITSNVIKKNQLKGGFEDISCTVRGQVVAGYGDEFQVGIQ